MDHKPVSSLTERAKLLEKDPASARTLVQRDLRMATAWDQDLQAWVHIDQQAVDQLDWLPVGPLTGVSVGVKDIIDVAGLPTRCGSPVTSSNPAQVDAACVSRLRQLGAVILGKTVTTEFGYFSPGATRNPADLTHSPGGSSSGSAAAVAAGTVPLALGTQTAGSLTRPASYCGAAGLVLAQNSVNLRGVAGLSRSLDSLGLLTRTVEDLRRVYGVFSEVPVKDSTRPSVYLWDPRPLVDIDSSMANALQIAGHVVRDLGYDMHDLEYDDHVGTLTEDHIIVMSHEAARDHSDLLENYGSRISPQLRTLLASGLSVSEGDYQDALVRRDRTREQFAKEYGPHRLLIGPAAQGAAPVGLEATGNPVLSRPWQLLGSAVVTVPGLKDPRGMPLGIQLISPPGLENSLFELGIALETHFREVSSRIPAE